MTKIPSINSSGINLARMVEFAEPVGGSPTLSSSRWPGLRVEGRIPSDHFDGLELARTLRRVAVCEPSSPIDPAPTSLGQGNRRVRLASGELPISLGESLNASLAHQEVQQPFLLAQLTGELSLASASRRINLAARRFLWASSRPKFSSFSHFKWGFWLLKVSGSLHGRGLVRMSPTWSTEWRWRTSSAFCWTCSQTKRNQLLHALSYWETLD